jgi:hypothetical protein
MVASPLPVVTHSVAVRRGGITVRAEVSSIRAQEFMKATRRDHRDALGFCD